MRSRCERPSGLGGAYAVEGGAECGVDGGEARAEQTGAEVSPDARTRSQRCVSVYTLVQTLNHSTISGN